MKREKNKEAGFAKPSTVLGFSQAGSKLGLGGKVKTQQKTGLGNIARITQIIGYRIFVWDCRDYSSSGILPKILIVKGPCNRKIVGL